jgi:hypothetical protein
MYFQFMVTITTFRKLALAFPDVTEEPHFERTSFRYKKKIFATYSEKENTAMLRLSEIDQSVFSSYEDGTVFYPVPGAWGKMGATYVNMAKVRKDMFTDALKLAYEGLANVKAKTKNVK